jgi:hypothetical protein
MGHPGRQPLPAAIEAGDLLVTLEERALEWIAPYWNASHLARTRDWLLELDPEAGEALRLAALTHDMERHFPGGPAADRSLEPEENVEYDLLHSERSACIVGAWLREQGAPVELASEVERLIRAHERGGAADEDLLQAADSLSFLETNAELVASWFTTGRCSRKRAEAQLRWMLERISLDRARDLARPLYEEAIAVVERA